MSVCLRDVTPGPAFPSLVVKESGKSTEKDCSNASILLRRLILRGWELTDGKAPLPSSLPFGISPGNSSLYDFFLAGSTCGDAECGKRPPSSPPTRAVGPLKLGAHFSLRFGVVYTPEPFLSLAGCDNSVSSLADSVGELLTVDTCAIVSTMVSSSSKLLPRLAKGDVESIGGESRDSSGGLGGRLDMVLLDDTGEKDSLGLFRRGEGVAVAKRERSLSGLASPDASELALLRRDISILLLKLSAIRWVCSRCEARAAAVLFCCMANSFLSIAT